MNATDLVPFRQVLLKVHSRCNLACDYCYVYEHADQSWRRQPIVMSSETLDLAAARLAEHVKRHALGSVTVILHGGEPLLAGVDFFDRAATTLRSAVGEQAVVKLRVQTNGVLLDQAFLEVFRRHDIRVGVSIDGDRDANDRHRRFARGASSHPDVVAALDRLRQPRYRSLYSGLLCVVDLRNDPVTVYESLLALTPPRIDFLLPHGNWTTPPPGRSTDGPQTPYADWLIAVFDRWYDAPRQETDVRLFHSLIDLLLGGRSGVESLGLEPIDLVTIETDGTIEQGDALKTTAEGMAATGLRLATHTLDDAAAHPGIRARQLGLTALSAQCRSCPVVAACGGGLYAHRYREENGFDNPSVFCEDLYALITHVRGRVVKDVARLKATREPAKAGRVPGTLHPPAYRLTEEQFRGLGSGYGDPETLLLLRSAQASKRRLLLLAIVTGTADGGDGRAWADAWAVLESVARVRPEVVDDVLGHPFVDAWATLLCAAPPQPGNSTATDHGQYLGALAIAAAARAGLDAKLQLPAPLGQVALPTLGLAHDLGAGPVTVIVTPSELVIEGTRRTVTVPAPYQSDGPFWCAHRQLTANSTAGPLTVTIEDLDPYRTCFELPVAARLSTDQFNRMSELVQQAWTLIGESHPEHARAMQIGLRCLVPLIPPEQGSISASSRVAFGSIAVSLTDDAADLALQMIHEAQHMKLSSLLDLVDLYQAQGTAKHFAAWRLDPRPVGALLQGAYAHAAVTDYWRIRRAAAEGRQAREAEYEFAYWLGQTRSAAETLLESGELTDQGTQFVNELVSTLTTWSREPVDAAVSQAVQDVITAASVRWKLANQQPGTEATTALAAAWAAGRECPPLPPALTSTFSALPAAPPDGLAGAIRRQLLGRSPTPARRAEVATEAFLASHYAEAASRYANDSLTDPGAADVWEGLAIAVGRMGGRTAEILRSRPDVVRALVVALEIGPPDGLGKLDALCTWIAGDPISSGPKGMPLGG